MNKGCCLGCFAVTALSVVLLIVAAFALERAVGVFVASERVSLTEAFGESHTVVIVANPNMPNALPVITEVLDSEELVLGYIMPHEVALFMDVDDDLQTRSLIFAISTKHLGGLISWWLPTPEDWDLGDGMFVQDMAMQRNGVFQMTAEGDLPETFLQSVRDRRATSDIPPPRYEGGHLLEILIDNRQGHGALALGSFFIEDEEETEDGDQEAEPDEEKESGDDRPVLNSEDWSILFDTVLTFRMTTDIADDETHQVALELQCEDSTGARKIVVLLNTAQERMADHVEDQRAELDGAFERDGAVVTGAFILSKYRRFFRRHIFEYFDEFQYRYN